MVGLPGMTNPYLVTADAVSWLILAENQTYNATTDANVLLYLKDGVGQSQIGVVPDPRLGHHRHRAVSLSAPPDGTYTSAKPHKMKAGDRILLFIVALCVTAGLLVTRMNAAIREMPTKCSEKSLQSGTTSSKKPTCPATGRSPAAIRQYGHCCTHFRVAVLLRCRRYAVLTQTSRMRLRYTHARTSWRF